MANGIQNGRDLKTHMIIEHPASKEHSRAFFETPSAHGDSESLVAVLFKVGEAIVSRKRLIGEAF
jgi:hypothetical protein